MEAVRYDVVVQQGSTFRLALYLTAANLPLNLTGYKARAQMRTEYGAVAAFLSFTSDDTTIVIDGPLGKLSLRAPATATTSLTMEEGVWDLEIVEPLGDVLRVVYGNVKVTPEVTTSTNL